MRVCFYSPYIPKHFGGGEKHLFDVARVAAVDHEVFIAVADAHVTAENTLQSIKKSYELFLGDALDRIKFIQTPLGNRHSFATKVFWTQQFDGMYYVTDGSLFYSLAKRNFLHIQTPLITSKKSLIEKLKLSNWHHKNTNSEFTKSIIEKYWHTKIDTVIHPMVDISKFNPTHKKSKIILSVGRFFRQLHSKRQDVLVRIFKELRNQNPQELEGWKLIIVGSIEDQEYFDEVKAAAAGLPVEVLPNVSGEKLIELYNSARVYWHAAGFGINELEHPEKVEHFGISTVEAMAAGVVPLVQFKGGQKEVLGSDLTECGWITEDECISQTLSLITDEVKWKKLQKLATARAENFNKTLFEKKVRKLFEYEQ